MKKHDVDLSRPDRNSPLNDYINSRVDRLCENNGMSFFEALEVVRANIMVLD